MSNFTVERQNMIESQIRPNGVTDVQLLKALYELPREAFVPPSMRSLAYMDAPLQVEAAREGRPARYLLAPMVFAKLTQLAEVKATDKVLDVGAATGYSTAVLAKLAAWVVAVECDAGLAAVATDTLSAFGIRNAEVVVGSLEKGLANGGLFDVIFVNGRLATRPETLLTQLAPGGRLVAMMGNAAPKARVFRKVGDAIDEVKDFDAGSPLLPGFEAKQSFVF